jgi:hypothetical protein
MIRGHPGLPLAGEVGNPLPTRGAKLPTADGGGGMAGNAGAGDETDVLDHSTAFHPETGLPRLRLLRSLGLGGVLIPANSACL